MRAWLAGFLARRHSGPVDVLVYGDGPGYDSLYLAHAGHRVSYYDVSEPGAAVARAVFAHSPTPIEMLSNLEGEPARWDTVLCLDVLEHVPDPGAIVRALALVLRDGGNLIVHAPFFCVSRDYPTHLESNRRLSGDLDRLFTPADLWPVDGRLFWDPIVFEKRRGARPTPRIRLRLGLGRLALLSMRVWARPQLALIKLFLLSDERRLRRLP